MSPREILRGARLVLCAERSATYVAACLLCRHDSGPARAERKPVAVWAMEHTRRHGLSHCEFLVTTQSHWRVDPLARPPAAPPPPPPSPRPPRPRRQPTARHARRRIRPLAESLLLMVFLVVSVTFGVGVSLGI